MWLVAVLALIRCTPGTKPDPDCDPKLEAEVVKPDKCGKIKDPAGPFRWEYSFYSIKNQCGALLQLHEYKKCGIGLSKICFGLWPCDSNATTLQDIYWKYEGLKYIEHEDGDQRLIMK